MKIPNPKLAETWDIPNTSEGMTQNYQKKHT